MSLPEPIAVRLRGVTVALAALARGVSPLERGTLACHVAFLTGWLIFTMIGHAPNPWAVSAGILGLLVLVVLLAVDGALARHELARAQNGFLKVLESKPTGAPRSAEFTCVHGDRHQYVYTPEAGWQPAGPVSDQARSR